MATAGDIAHGSPAYPLDSNRTLIYYLWLRSNRILNRRKQVPPIQLNPKLFQENTEMTVEERLESLGLSLPPAPKPVGLYKPMYVIGNLATLSGHGPLKSDGTLYTGRLGADMTLEQGQVAARQTALAMLATLKAGLGSLERIRRVVKLLALVRCTDEFEQQPAVINGCSQLFVDLWGTDRGIGTRSALGTNSLPGGIAVEIEGVFEIE